MQHAKSNYVPEMAQVMAAPAEVRIKRRSSTGSSISISELTELMPYLHRFAYSLTRNADYAADLVQDTVERALRKSHLFDGANLRAWLTTICKRIFLNNIRRDKLRRFDVCIDDAPANRLCVPPEQENQLHFADIAAALERLPEKDRLLISMCGVTGMKYLEVAERLGIPIGTVRSKLSRARLKLARLVSDATDCDQSSVPAIAPPARGASDETTHYA